MDAAAARFNGTLKKWNADRGFGFVAAEHSDQDLFVHVSAFPRDGRLPTVGEPLSFEVALDRDAVQLRRSHPLLTNDFVCRSHPVPAPLPGYANGWRWGRRPV